jgi:hypothetical protein
MYSEKNFVGLLCKTTKTCLIQAFHRLIFIMIVMIRTTNSILLNPKKAAHLNPEKAAHLNPEKAAHLNPEKAVHLNPEKAAP